MIANSTDKKTFKLTDNNQFLGALIYENLFYLNASIKLANSEAYNIKPVGIFGTRIAVVKNGTEISNLKMNWKGQIVIAFNDEQEYILKVKGILANTFVIENKDSEPLIQFIPKFNWSKFNYSFDIVYDQKPKDILFVLLCIYSSTFLIASMSGATSGIA